jgi:hypothetical protein
MGVGFLFFGLTIDGLSYALCFFRCLEAEGRSSTWLGFVAMLFALCRSPEVLMPAIASLEDLRAAQKDLLEAKDLNELKKVFKKWRRIGWKNVCKLWLQERTPEELKGEGG